MNIPAILALMLPAAMATLTPTLPRGEQITSHNIGEVCIIPKKLPGGLYSDKDISQEQKLCAIEFEGDTKNVATCGKTNSTNPGVLVYKLPENMTSAQLEAQNCFIPNPQDKNDNMAKVVAKYKQSVSCSYTPSILAYYHVSRYLGGIVHVPVAVLRTMDIQRHIEIGEKTIPYLDVLEKKGEDVSMLKLTWPSLVKILKSGGQSKYRDQLMSDDFHFSYGALQLNPKGEANYREMFNGGANQQVRAQRFRDNSPIYRKLIDAHELSAIVSTTWSQSSLQDLLQMQDASNMIIMDTMLSQEDRFGNQHYIMSAYELKDGKVVKVDASENPSALQVKEMLLKDNDCGVNRENHIKNEGLLLGMKHIDPNVYHRLLQLKKDLETQDATMFFRRETMMTQSDFNTFKANVAFVAENLHKACVSGSLHLDLDLNGHFAGQAIDKSCDVAQ